MKQGCSVLNRKNSEFTVKLTRFGVREMHDGDPNAKRRIYALIEKLKNKTKKAR
jgi:hypothetical protein